MQFSDILGQEKIKSHFRQAIKAGTTSHAYIIEGEKSSGKMMLAKAFAQSLLCENFDEEPCGICPACLKTISENHPDIIYVNHEKPNLISVDEIRQQVDNDILIKPYEAQYKVYIIDESDKMNDQAQNAILKTIEEPPSYGVILLLTDNANKLLPTIRSRCIKLSMVPVNQQELKTYLMEKYDLVDYQALSYASYSQGVVGSAVNMINASDENALRESIARMLGRLGSSDGTEHNANLKLLEDEKDYLPEIFNLMTIWYRDVLLYKSTGQSGKLIFQDEVRAIKEIAENTSYYGISKSLEAIETTRTRMKCNVNRTTNLDLLLRNLKENK